MSTDDRRSNSRRSRSVPKDVVPAKSTTAAFSMFEQLVNNTTVRFIVADTNLRITYMNKASFEMLEQLEHLLPCKVSEIIGSSIDIFHKNPEHQRKLLSNVRNLPHRAEIKLGNEILDLNVAALYDDNNKLSGFMVNWEVITEKVKSQNDSQRLQQMVENTTVRLIMADINFKIIYMNPASIKTLKELQHLLPCRVDEIIGQSIDIFHKDPSRQQRMLANPNNLPHKANIQLGNEILELNVVAIRDAKGNYIGPMINWEVITDRIQAIEREEMFQMEQKQSKMELERKVNEMMQVVQAAAAGDLTKNIATMGEDDIGRLAGSLQKMLGDLRTLISQVVESALQQGEGARAIAESSANMSDGAQSQAASVEEITASIQELVMSINVISDAATDARKQANESASLARAGGTTVNEAVSAMKLIQKSSEQINDIIQVIGEIASQTNLLALNAAIEAARAGEHGLGFAVVADEVRKLAERSSEAAKEITKLIKESTRRVSEGAELSEKVGQSLKAIVDAVDRTSDGIGKIAVSTETQATSANEVQKAIKSVSDTTESNAAGAEELAASAEELGAQAATLQELVSRFKL